jgi:hypothetical protein
VSELARVSMRDVFFVRFTLFYGAKCCLVGDCEAFS